MYLMSNDNFNFEAKGMKQSVSQSVQSYFDSISNDFDQKTKS